jgi:RNA polymerase sigma factor (TIGR02999 family)
MSANGRAARLARSDQPASPTAQWDGSDATHRRDPSVTDRTASIAAKTVGPSRGNRATDDFARVLEAIDRGEPLAASELLPLVYDELRKVAAQKLAQEKPGQTLDPTALVHEAYLRIVAGDQDGTSRASDPVWANRRHFFGAAAEAMRRILVENARRKAREKHGGGRRREHADLDALSADGVPQDILALHGALEQFAVRDPLKAKLVELRYFGGLTLEQAAACLEISLSTADRAWRYARAWLYAAMADADPDEI